MLWIVSHEPLLIVLIPVRETQTGAKDTNRGKNTNLSQIKCPHRIARVRTGLYLEK